MNSNAGIASSDYLRTVRARALARGAIAPWRPPRGMVIGIVVSAIALHMLLAWWLSVLMRPRPSIDDGKSILVTLIDESPPLPALPEPPARTTQRAPITAHTLPMHPSAASEPPVAPETTLPKSSTPSPDLHLYNADGAVRVAPEPKLSAHELELQRGHELMRRGHNLLHCRRGRYDPTPTPEQVGRKGAKYAAASHMFDDPHDIELMQDQAESFDIDLARENGISDRMIADRACDDTLYTVPPTTPGTLQTMPENHHK